MCTTRALIGQYPCLDQSIQTRKFPAKVNSIIWLNKCITQVNWKISISLLRLTHLVNIAMFLRIIDFKLSLILHLLTCGQPQTDSKTLALVVVLSIRHVVHILSSPSQLFEYHPQTALRLLGIDQHASRFDCLLLILNIYETLPNFDRQISHKPKVTITNNTFLLKIPCVRA